MRDSKTIRERVSQDYAEAVKSPGKGCGGGDIRQKGVAVKVAGYSREELAQLPDDAVVNSFGCGNPLAFSRVEEGQTVVDLGSGAGIDILLAAKRVGPGGRVIGIDMTDEMIEAANANIEASGLSSIEVRKGLIEDMPIESGTVDWVISNCVINLSPEKDRVFAEIARVLKPGGRLAISDIVVQDLPDRVKSDPALYSGCIAGAISEEQYVQGLRDAGLGDVRVTDRITYDAGQLSEFIVSELSASERGQACGCGCGGTSGPDRATQIADEVAGRIWSARFEARKL
ncbi:MAG: arsenite methyltransferase [Planctomycetota bacterium]|jgi:SAM-dependent methyltransferase